MPSTGTYSRAAFTTRLLRAAPRAAWFGARARNVVQRPRRLFLVGLGVFVGVLVAYLLLPAGVRGAVSLVRTRENTEWRDSASLATRETLARRRLVSADSALALIRSQSAALMAAQTAVRVPISTNAERDSLAAAMASLAALIQRAENAPLPESFRALARSPQLRDDPRVRAFADTLTEIERERDELGGGATVDPVFVALTTQANEMGRRIAAQGEQRMAVMTRQLLALQERPAPSIRDTAAVVLPDSQRVLTARRNASVVYEAARRLSEQARKANLAADSIAARERARNQLAPLPILVTAALILAIVATFAFALLDEMRSPRVADAVEAERLTTLRVLGVARIRSVPPDRTRRAADRALPSVLDPTFDTYRVLAWHLASQWPKDGIVTVTGDNPLVAATVAANLAAVLANDARVTLLIDADLKGEPVRAILALPRSPGLSAVLENRRKWSESLVSVPVGRARTIDVLPAGGRASPLGPAESEALTGEIQRAARRHDATIVVTTLAGAKRFRAGDDVVVCATQTRTRLATLARTVASLIDDGARVRGVVLWDGPLPMASRKEATPAGEAA